MATLTNDYPIQIDCSLAWGGSGGGGGGGVEGRDTFGMEFTQSTALLDRWPSYLLIVFIFIGLRQKLPSKMTQSFPIKWRSTY